MASTSTTTTTSSSSSSSQPPPPPRPPIRYPLPIPAPPTSFPPLLRHHDAVLNSDYKTAFSGASDVVARLLPWHVWQIPEDVIALARHRAISSSSSSSADVKGKGKEKVESDAVVQRPPGKRRRTSTGVARIQKAGRSDEADFDAIEGLSYPADDELDDILTRYSALRQRHVQLRHRGLGGEPTTTTAQQDEMVPPLPATPFSKEGHLQLLGLAYHQDRSDLEAAANELNEARQKLVETYGPQWQQQLDSVAPHFEMPSLPPLHPRHTSATTTRTAGPSSAPASTPAPAPAPAPPAPSPAAAAPSPAPTKRQTSPTASRKSKAKQAAAATPASPAGQATPRPRPPPPPPPSAQQQSPAPGSGSGSGSNAASPAPIQASSSASPSNFPRPRPAYGAAPGGSASTPASAAAAAAAAAEVAATKARSASPAAPPQAAGAAGAAGGPAGTTNPAPTPPLRIILPLNLISKLTSAGIAPVPAKHLQPAIDAHKRQTSGGGGGPVSYSTAPCEPDPKQREAAVLLGITEGPANGSSTQRHQLVHLSVLLSRLTPPQLNALAEAVNLVQQQSAPPPTGGGAAPPGGQPSGGGGGQQ